MVMGGNCIFCYLIYFDDILHRLLLLLQMGVVGAMAVNISDAFSDTFSGFALICIYSFDSGDRI
jgi:hypothetical protein